MPDLNQEFITRPHEFLSTYPLNLLKMNKMSYQGADCGVQADTIRTKIGYFNLQQGGAFASNKEVSLVSVPNGFNYGANTPLQGYFANYFGVEMQKTKSADEMSVDVPKSLPPHQFVFTGQLNGCSMIVQDNGGDSLTVIHDARVNSASRYSNVKAFFDFSEYKFDKKVMYGGSLQDTGFASVVMYRDARANIWTLACQLLDVDLRNEVVKLRALKVKFIL